MQNNNKTTHDEIQVQRLLVAITTLTSIFILMAFALYWFLGKN